MTNLNWHGLVAIVLALGLAVAVVLLCLETILHRGPVSDSEAAVLSTVLGAAVGAVATYLGASGAPATEVRTRTAMSPPWSTDWISEDGRRKLAEHGIAPPRGGARHVGGPVLLQISPSPRAAQACPRCGSTDTREISAFGSTPCQSLRACRACGEPFGAMKSL